MVRMGSAADGVIDDSAWLVEVLEVALRSVKTTHRGKLLQILVSHLGYAEAAPIELRAVRQAEKNDLILRLAVSLHEPEPDVETNGSRPPQATESVRFNLPSGRGM